ncbi:pirin family protein [Planktothrix paucivesiculata]|uniref:Quercetin 2,3-dioxygenase n=1 Tax=Planktothrix paucivesiculata PCC 9631 TaxID=671071 RepID=A0A7Z9BVR3_9CYAN|nr:pirin family protein [Planktothrix paucivesiculata]VXD19543.1 putative Quercetin 2,3-dioxygenase [Planktothrix paucivesiculata PCC 9631]
MITVRKSQDRGQVKIDWLESYHTFSFGNYYDPEYMGWRSLRVINEDRVQPMGGFPTHGHQNMEIITYILQGSLEHKDSLGTGSIIQPGEVQRMSAGTGIRHSEFNPSATDQVHLLQIWLLPDTQGLPPSYEQKSFNFSENSGQFQLIATRNPVDQAVKIHQDVNLYAGILKPSDRISYSFSAERYGWLQVAKGEVILNQIPLTAGDGAAIAEEPEITLTATTDAEILLFDLA